MRYKFKPDYVVAPGETIRETMDAMMLCEEDLANFMDYDIEFILDLLAGNTDLTPTVAARLESTLGIPKQFWLNAEANYRRGIDNE